MATAAPKKPNPAAVRDAVVDQAIAAAAGKVRANDLLTGSAAAGVLFLGYLAVVVVLDKLFTLPDWVRLLGLVGLLGGLATVVFFLIVRPMQRRVNPRYVARKIEDTLPDAKNVLINWVDLQDEELPGSVKAAVGANAAAGVADADVDSATNSKPVVWLGGAAGGLVITLAVLFLVFSGPQFLSLLQRAVVPFKSTEIVSATTITIDEPESGDVIVTDGQPLTIAVTIDGRLPNPNGPEKPRLLVKYSLETNEEIELPLTATGSSREFRTDLSRSTILNGFWYRVAAGDARTPEHQVKVVTRPMLGEFKASYEYPSYLKWPSDGESGAKLRAIRGTTVTLTAKANRTVQSATLTAATVDGTRELVRGEVFGDRQDWVRFKLKLRENGTYRIDFKPSGPESSTATADYPIEVEVDHKPVVVITSPKEDEMTLPLNGQLDVDGTVKDDHGIARIELRFKLDGDDVLAIRPKVYQDGQPLERERDGTLIPSLTGENGGPMYKDSVRLNQLTDVDGRPVKLKEGDVLLYWLAAMDNCTEPKANEGESTPRKRIRLVAPPKEPEKQQQQQSKAQDRQKEEKANQDKLQDKMKNEKRPEEQGRNPDRQPQQPEKQPEGQEPKTDPKQNEGDPQKKPDTPPEGNKGEGTTQEDQDFQKKADELKEKLDKQREQQKQDGGDSRGDGDKAEGMETKPEANTKPSEGKSGDGGSKGAAEEKAGPKPEDMTKPDGKPGEGKENGKLVDPQRSEDKQPPKPDAKGEDQPTGDQQKGAPKEGTDAGTSKESKESPPPQPNDTKQPQNPKNDGSASSARGTEPPAEKNGKPQDSTGNSNDPSQSGQQQKKVDPKDLSGSKPKGEPERGSVKPEPKQGGGEKSDGQKEEKNAGEAKGEAPMKPGESKDASKGGEKDPMSKKGAPSDAGQEKQPPQPGSEAKDDPAQGKGEGTKPEKNPTDGSKGQGEPGSVKSSDPKKSEGGKTEAKTPPQGSGEKQPKNPNDTPGGAGEKNPEKTPPQGGGNDGQKLDSKEMEQAIKDLESKDPKAKQSAQEKLDKAVGKENRQQMEQMQKDLKSDDQTKRDAAQKKLEEMAKQGQKSGAGQEKPKELTEQEKKELVEAAKNLDSKDEKTRKDAQQKLDQAVGKENRQQMEQMQKDLKSDDKDTREAAEKKVQEMAKQAQQQDNTAKKPEMTEEQKKQLAAEAQKLNSKDEAERKAAEQKLDEAIGKKNREELQQDLKDLQGNDPAKAEQARKKLEKKTEEAKNAQAGDSQPHENRPDKLGGGNNTTPGKPIDADLANQLKAGELRLDDIRKHLGDKQFLKDNRWTEEEYNRFLKQEEAAVQKLRDQVADTRVNPKPETGGPATIRNDFGKVESRGKADKLDGSTGVSRPPPGFDGAIKRFNGEASKQPK